MNTLIIINGAPSHRPFFLKVGVELQRRGNKVLFVKDSKFTDHLYPDAPLPSGSVDFAQYFREHYDSAVLPARYASLNLWTAAFTDLDRAEHASSLRRGNDYFDRLLVCLVCFFDELYSTHHIECVAYENVSNVMSYVAYQVATACGIRYVGFAMSRLPQRIDVCDVPEMRHSATATLYRELVAGTRIAPAEVATAARDYLANLDERKPDYILVNAGLAAPPWRRYFRSQPLTNVTNALRWYMQDEDRWWAHQMGNPWVAYPEHFARETLRYARANWLKHLVEPPDLEKAFFFYPVQIHPESTIAVDGRYATEEFANVLNIATNLPIGTLLYVKDHPMAPGRFPLAFYRRLKRIPNVRLITPSFDSKTLIRRAKAVITITSSAGIEAIALGKPTFVLGQPFYEFHPLVRRITSWDDAFEIFSRHTESRCTPEEREAFIAAYFMSSIAGSYDLARAQHDPSVVGAIASAIECDPVAAQLHAKSGVSPDTRA